MVKNILFKFTLNGEGIVNYDNSDQSFIHNSLKTDFKGNRNNNINYSKKNFYRNSNGDVSWKIKISSNCLRHAIFIKDAYSQSPSILKADYLSYNYIASPANILRGYVFAIKGANIKRKSPINIVDAEQSNNSISIIEQFTKSGNKESGKKDASGDNISSDTMFMKETTGHMEYKSYGNIDLMQLQFVSCSQEFDRYAFNPDNIDLYRSVLNGYLEQNNIKDDLKIDNYIIKNSSVKLSEEGILFSNDTVNFFVKEFFKRMLLLEIRRSGSYAKLSSLEYKFVIDPIEDTYESEDGWISILNEKDVNSINFDMENFYEVANEEIIQQTNKAIDSFNKNDFEIRKGIKQKKEEDKISKRKSSIVLPTENKD